MHLPHHGHVLQLDIQGTPQAWISLEHAAVRVATRPVAWVDGDGPLGLPARRPPHPCRRARVAGRAPAEGIAPELTGSGAKESVGEGKRSQARGS